MFEPIRRFFLNQLKRDERLPDLEYGMYVEIHDFIYHCVDYGFLVGAFGGNIVLVNNKGEKMDYPPKWQTVYYNNPIEKKIIYDYRV